MIKVGVLAYDYNETLDTINFVQNVANKLHFNIEFGHVDPKKHSQIKFISNPLKYDIILSRIGLERSLLDHLFALKVSQLIEKQYMIPFINRTIPVQISDDKYLQTILVKNTNVPIIETALINLDNYKFVLKNFTFPVIIKKNFGYGGESVKLGKTFQEIKTILEKAHQQKELMIVQEYVNLPEKKDFRVRVFGNKISGGLIRQAKSGDFRSNVAQGGSCEYYNPPKELIQKARTITKIFNLDIAAVDFFHHNHQYIFLEINPSLQIGIESVAIDFLELIQNKLKVDVGT